MHALSLPRRIAALALLTLMPSLATEGSGTGDIDRSLAPRFEITGGESATERFPLKSTRLDATISGVIAEVTVEQTYTNTGDRPIEATYLFPASTRAAVHGVEMRIGERVIVAKVKEKAEAKATYERAKAANQTASLLDQERPNVFRMKVAHILPGDEVAVTLRFSEKLTATDRVYEFVYPTVVGPRYSSPASPAEAGLTNPYLAEGTPSSATFAADVEVRAGMPLQSLTCASHQPTIRYTGKQRAVMRLPADRAAADRDLVIRYRLADEQVRSGLLLHEGETENFFLLNVEPPARVTPDQIPPRDYVFILDVSGSMNGFPLNTAKGLMRDLLEGLRPTDTFNVMLFAGTNRILSEHPLPATPENIARGTDLTHLSQGGGGTELLPALKRALALPGREDLSRSIVVVTDGYITVEREAFDLVRDHLGQANLFAFGIGSSVNRWLIEGLARAGQGEPFFVLNPSEASRNAARFRDYISSPVLTHVRVHYEGFAASEVQPKHLPDVFADRPIELIGKWTGEGTGRIIVSGQGGGGPFEASFDVADEAAHGTNNPSLRPLWARERVRTLADQSLLDDQAKREHQLEITNLGLTYHLLTDYTSFVGVDETPREVLEALASVTQPLPLPHGVSSQALGGGHVTMGHGGTPTGAAPEPGTAALLLLTGLGLLFHRQRVAA